MDCQKDFKIMYAKDNKTSKLENGFLRENNIITQYSTKLKDCQLKSRSLLIVTENSQKPFLIIRNQTKVFLKNFETKLTSFRISSGNLLELYNHHDYLVNGSDFYERISEFIDPSQIISFENEKNQNYFDHDIRIANDNPFLSISVKIKHILRDFKWIFMSLISLFLILIIIKNFERIYKFLIEFNFKKREEKKQTDETELNFV